MPFRDELLAEMAAIRTVDCHSHTMLRSAYYAHGGHDIFSIVHYFAREMQALLGAPDKTTQVLYAGCATDEERWSLLRRAIDYAGNTSYWRHNVVMYQRLFGLQDDELDDGNWRAVNEQIAAKTADADWYRHVTEDICGLRTQVRNVSWYEAWEPQFFTAILRMEPALHLLEADPRSRLEDRLGRSLDSLEAARDGVRAMLEAYVARGARGIKLGHAYWRTLASADVPATVAGRTFQRALRGEPVTPEETTQFQDHMIFFLADLVEEMGLVFQIHTGVQTNWGLIRDSDPLHLIPLIQAHRGAKFDLFHAGYPYVREMGMLGKHYPNVYLNMCWMYVVSMEASRQGLSEWIDLVAGERLLGFGSDVSYPELIYPHLIMARSCLADVLAAKVERDFLSKRVALELLRKMLHDNPARLFGL